MTSIELTVTGATAQAKVDGYLTAGMVGLPVTVRYDSDWDGLTKTLVCKAGGSRPESAGIVKAILNVENEATVAPEVMIAKQSLWLGVEGRNADGSLVIPTVWAFCGRIQPSVDVDDDSSTDYTLPVWAQLQAQIDDLKQNGGGSSGEDGQGGSGGGGTFFRTDETLNLSPDGVLSVNTADEANPDNTLPITSAAVANTVGNIEILLGTI